MIPFYEKMDFNVRVFYADNLQFPLHLHSAVEILYQEAGETLLTLDNRQIEICPGSLTFVFPNHVHGYTTSHSGDSLTLLMMFEPKILPDFLSVFRTQLPQTPMLTKDQLHQDVHYARKGLVEEYYANPSSPVLKAFLQLLLGRTLPCLSLRPNEPADGDLTYRLIRHISQHFREPLTLDQIARELGVSKYYLSRIFSQKLNTSFREYLNQLRLDYACALLQTSEQPVAEICLEAGFEHLRTFNRVFQQLRGTTPSAFRASDKSSRED